jgi:PIN domain nuclease of toxin-antitoxin system
VKLLLDTHAFLWFIQGNEALSDVARAAIENQVNQKFISVASLWEIAIKVNIGRLAIGMSITDLVNRELLGNAFDILNIASEHLDELATLPFQHKDPFDRLIISQSLVENIPIISRDRMFENYSAQLLW